PCSPCLPQPRNSLTEQYCLGMALRDSILGTRKSFLLARTLREQNLGSGLNPRTIFPVKSPYEDMNIAGITGLTAAQKATLKALGGVELVATDC
ncbi:hypothetical protein, partial [uncultured Nostoc sp.]|uniref:hypothetical protein n=1 Tax=uncultured Nostoc sp. TaxID=340711 RepID=UPI0035CC75A2